MVTYFLRYRIADLAFVVHLGHLCGWGDQLVDQLKKDPFESLASVPCMNFSFEKLLIAGNEIPEGVILLWHDIVPFPQLEGGTVVSLPITNVDEVLVLGTVCRLNPFDDLALHMVSKILVPGVPCWAFIAYTCFIPCLKF